MTPCEAVKKLRNLTGDDPEKDHSEADLILLDLLGEAGMGDVAAEWRRASERCGGFWYA